MKIIKQKHFSTTADIIEIPNLSQQTISEHIRQLGLVYTYSRWAPNHFTERHLTVFNSNLS